MVLNGVLTTYQYTHSLVHLSSLIRDTSFYRRKHLTQRPTTDKVHRIRNCRILNLNRTSISHPPPAKLRDQCKKGVRKFVRAKDIWITTREWYFLYTVTSYAQGLLRLRPDKTLVWRREVDMKSMPS